MTLLKSSVYHDTLIFHLDSFIIHLNFNLFINSPFKIFIFKQTVEEKDKTIAKLEAEKYYLGERVFELTGVEESFWNDEQLVFFLF